MKLFTILFLFLVTLPLTAFSQNPILFEKPNKETLKEFVSIEDNFKAVFPGTPTVSKQNGKKVVETSYKVLFKTSFWAIYAFEFEFEVEKFGKPILENYRNTVAGYKDQKILAERWIEFENGPALELDVLTGDRFERLRVFMFSKKMYQVSAVVGNWLALEKNYKTKIKEFEEEAARFADSFRFVNPRVIEPEPTYKEFFGEVKDEIYENKFFKFSIKFPGNWKTVDPAEIDGQKDIFKEFVKDENGKITNQLLEAINKNFTLFYVSDEKNKRAKGIHLRIHVTKQPNPLATAEMIVKTSIMVFANSPNYKLLESVSRFDRFGQTFGSTKYEITVNTGKNYVLSYIMMRKSYSLIFEFGVHNQEDFEIAEQIFNSIKFE